MADANEIGRSSAMHLGSRGLALSAEAIYNVAHGLSTVELDSSALEKLSQKSSGKFSCNLISKPSVNSKANGPFLGRAEARAALVLIAHKLLQADATIRPVVPRFIAHVLNCNIALNLPLSEDDSAVVWAVVEAIYSFKGDSLLNLEELGCGELGLTTEEVEVMLSSFPASVGIGALAAHSSSALSVIADAVASLSCEAAEIDAQAFDLDVSGEGFSYKAETDVGSDIRKLLFGSKLAVAKKGGSGADSLYFSIPSSHGSLREDVKTLANRVRIEVNSAVAVKKKSGAKQNSTVQPSTKAILSLAMSLQSIGTSSFHRAKHIISRVINSLDSAFRLDEKVLEQCPSADALKTRVQSIFAKAVSETELSTVYIANQVFALVEETRKILAWEAACALSALGLRERLAAGETKERNPKPEGTAPEVAGKECGNGGGNVEENDRQKVNCSENKGKQRGEKKKGNREIVLGKGTAVIRQLIFQIIQHRCQNGNETACVLAPVAVWAEELQSFFDPKDSELQMLLDSMKTVVESNEARRLPKIPKGTRDFTPEEMAIREKAFAIIEGVFKRHGAVALDTPVFELRETLMGKYGEDSKLIYDLADQGGEICSLRYDLTVPFARYLATYNINNLKRYHIARVYRRDNPSKGRYREFYQCDFDIAGQYATMVPDFESVKVLTELLDELDIGDYEVKLNHRKLLDGMLEVCGVPQAKFRTVCSAIDKLDKQSWEQVQKEMVEQKGLTPDMADRIGSLVLKRGKPLQLLAELKLEGSPFMQHGGSVLALEELEILFHYLEASDCLNRIVFDLSLARGLDYYTGVIYEAVFKGTTQVGSIAAGGRYDNLVGMFSGKQVPAVGVSLGIERVFTIMAQLEKDRKKVIRPTQTDVLVVAFGDDIRPAIKLVNELWMAKLKVEFIPISSKRIIKYIKHAEDSGIPWMLILGETELQNGLVKLKDIQANIQEDILRDKIVAELQKRLNASTHVDFNAVVQ